MRVYRIQHHRTRRGIYNPNGGLDDWLTDDEYRYWSQASQAMGEDTSMDRHLAPFEEKWEGRDDNDRSEFFVPEHYFFGFRSLRQLFDWVSPRSLHLFYKAGFNIVTFEVPDEHVMVGSVQVVFERGEATSEYVF